MSIAIEELARSVFQKPLDDCRLDELRQLAQQYPYFAPLHLFLSKKLKANKSESFKDQVQKTSLYFQNRLWLEHLLTESTSKVQIISDAHGGIEEKELAEYTDLNHPEQSIEPILKVENPEMKMTDERTIIENKEKTGPQSSIEIPPKEIEPLPADNTDKAEFIFQPYHTVDYFASQGVKFKEEEKPKDRFGQQLKSFTEWLKTMKRLPVSEIISASDTHAEKKVEELAEHSIADRDVVTEAMADVWKKQGNYAKAEDIYRKLSLLDPRKSSYFAAKIDQIKKT